MTTHPPFPRIAPTLCLILLLALLQPGCTAQRTATPNLPSAAPATATATQVATPTATPLPTATSTAAPINIPPTQTALPTPTLALLPTQTIPRSPLALSAGNAAGMRRLARWGLGKLNDFAWSPDGKTLAVATGVGVRLYDTATFKETQFIDVNDNVTHLAFRPDSQAIAVAVDTQVSVWSVASGQKMAQMKGSIAGGIWKVVYGAGGQIAAIGQWARDVGGAAPHVMLWQAATGQIIYQESNILGYSQALDISPDGKDLLCWSSSGLVILDIQSRKPINSMSEDAEEAVFSPDGTAVYFTQTENGAPLMKRWNIASDTVDALPPDFPTLEFTRTLSPDGRYRAAQTGSNTLEIKEVGSGQTINTLVFPNFTSQAVGMAQLDGEMHHLIAVGLSGEIQLWDLASGKVVRTLPANGAEVTGVAFSPDGHSLASAAAFTDHVLRLWDISAGVEKIQYDLGEPSFGPLVFSPDGARLAMPGSGGEVMSELDLQSGRTQGWRSHPSQPGTRYSPIYRPYAYDSAGHILGWQIDWDVRQLILTDVITQAEIRFPLPPQVSASWNSWMETLTISPDSRYLAVGAESGELFVWDMQSQKFLHTIKAHHAQYGDGFAGAFSSLEFSPTTDLLVSVGWDGTTALWNPATGAELRRLAVCCYAGFTPDGRYLVTAGQGAVRVWGVEP